MSRTHAWLQKNRLFPGRRQINVVDMTDTRYFRPRRLGHVNVVVGNVDRSMAFYRDVAGIAEAYVQPLNRAVFLSNGNTHHDIGMVESSGPLGRGRPPGLNHIAFELENEVELVEGYQRAVADKVSFTRTVDHDIAHSVYGRDPDGNHYEIYADVIRDWRSARSGVVTKPKPVWAPGMTPPIAERNYDPDPQLTRVEGAVFHPRRTTHATFVAEHFEEAVDYYTRIVGLTILTGGRDAPFALLGGSLGQLGVALFRAGAGQRPGLHHIGLEVRDEADLDASVARLRAGGGAPVVDIQNALRRAVFVHDPDGIRLQFHVARQRALPAWNDVDPAAALLLL
jgi:catechol 2,3-dioxygenase